MTRTVAPYRIDVTSDPLAALPAELQAIVRAELALDEIVTWAAQPIAGRAARRGAGAAAFAIPWTAFAVFWMVSAARGSVVFSLFGIPFVAVGLSMLLQPYVAYQRARRSACVVTNRRAIGFYGERRGGMKIRSFTRLQLEARERVAYPDGSGDLSFTREIQQGRRGDRTATSVGFLDMADVSGAHQAVRVLLESRDAPCADDVAEAYTASTRGESARE